MNLRSLKHCLVILATASAVFAMPDEPGPATVCVARGEKILVPQGISAPKLLYPQGRVDFDVVEKLVDAAVANVTGLEKTEGWRALFKGSDRVGIMVEAGRYPVQLATVETVIDRLVNSGVDPSNIVVFGADERDLFMAGFNISRDEKSVRVLGAQSEGFRGGISRIVTDYCDAIINIGTLQLDPDIGFGGCLSNTLTCVPATRRMELRRQPTQLASVATNPALRQKTRLVLLEAYLPLLAMQDLNKTTWQYGGLLAGTDPVAVDVVGQQILHGCFASAKITPPQPAEYLRPAQARYRVGQSDPQQITVKVLGWTPEAYVGEVKSEK
jgi:hypothetical protein